MYIQTTLGSNALSWVKSELVENLNSAQSALETYASDPEHQDQLFHSKLLLQQVCGTLELMEFDGALMYAEALESIVHGLSDESLDNPEEALGNLRLAIQQLPHYLDFLEDGDPDIPIVLLSSLNQIRSYLHKNTQLSSRQLVFQDLASQSQATPGSQVGRIDLKLLEALYHRLSDNLSDTRRILTRMTKESRVQIGLLESCIVSLAQTADGLRMLGVTRGRERIDNLIYELEEMTSDGDMRTQGAVLILMDKVADEERSLNQFLTERSSAAIAERMQTHNASRPGEEPESLLPVELVNSALTHIGKVKGAVINFIDEPEDNTPLMDALGALSHARTEMSNLGMEQEGKILKAIGSYIQYRLLKLGISPGEKDLATLADAVTSIELYIEESAHPTIGNLDTIIQVGYESVAELGYPIKSAPAMAGAARKQQTKAKVAAGDANLKMLSSFSDKVGQECKRLEDYMPKWRKEPELEETMYIIAQGLDSISRTASLVDAKAIRNESSRLATELKELIEGRGKPTEALIDRFEESLIDLPRQAETLRKETTSKWALDSVIQEAEIPLNGDSK